MCSAQGLKDQTRVAGPWRRWPGPLLRPGPARPAAAARGAQVTATARPFYRTRAPVARPSMPASRRGRLRGRGRERGRRLTHAYTRPSASSTPSPPYRGTCVQQPRHIRAGPARPLRRPRLLPGRGLGPPMHPGRARVTWRAAVRQTEARWGSPRARGVTAWADGARVPEPSGPSSASALEP